MTQTATKPQPEAALQPAAGELLLPDVPLEDSRERQADLLRLVWDHRRLLLRASSVQHERWLFPSIQPNVSRNVTASIQILFEPHKLFQHSAAGGLGDRP